MFQMRYPQNLNLDRTVIAWELKNYCSNALSHFVNQFGYFYPTQNYPSSNLDSFYVFGVSNGLPINLSIKSLNSVNIVTKLPLNIDLHKNTCKFKKVIT